MTAAAGDFKHNPRWFSRRVPLQGTPWNLRSDGLMSSSSRAVPSSPDPAGQACYLSASNAQAWQAVYSSVDAYTRGQVAAVVSDSANELVDAFIPRCWPMPRRGRACPTRSFPRACTKA
ncbi:hypothetical protein WJ969_30845 [Achromobacter xylosoxidans]